MRPLKKERPPSSPGCPAASNRRPVACPYCGKAAVVWADRTATARGLWVKCKNPVCKREFEIKI